MSDHEFFIGWLPLPPGYSRFLAIIVPLVMLLVAAAALALPLWQQSPGPGRWEAESVVTVEGVLRAEPYAMLRVPADGNPLEIRTMLLVEEGKFGARERALPLAGQYVRATGTYLHRDGRWMLELAADANAMALVEPPPSANFQRLVFPTSPAAAPVTLRGEIIDPKCYLGAMRPGGGKTHKACAALCVSGGIPPMLVTRDSTGREMYFLLTAQDGSSAKEIVLSYVGDLVELQGRLEVWDDLQVLRLSAGGIRRV